MSFWQFSCQRSLVEEHGIVIKTGKSLSLDVNKLEGRFT